MGKKNVARSGFTAVQVGRIVPECDDDCQPTESGESGEMKTVNVRKGNATVGVQADEIKGGLTVRF